MCQMTLPYCPEHWYWKVKDLTSSAARKFLQNTLDWDNADDEDLKEIAFHAKLSCNLFNLVQDTVEEDDGYVSESVR